MRTNTDSFLGILFLGLETVTPCPGFFDIFNTMGADEADSHRPFGRMRTNADSFLEILFLGLSSEHQKRFLRYDCLMKFLYYFKECPTCKNETRNLTREVALHKEVELDERYIFALPDVWGKAAEEIGTPIPFVYNTETKESIHVDASAENMREQLSTFFTGKPETS